MPEYEVVTHSRVLKFLSVLKDEKLKNSIVEVLGRLQDDPASLREMDVEKIKGLKGAFRVVGRYRMVFFVDKNERKVFVTHLETRKRIHKRIGRASVSTMRDRSRDVQGMLSLYGCVGKATEAREFLEQLRAEEEARLGRVAGKRNA